MSVRFTENAEIDNIKKRLELTSNPGRTGFVLLMNEAGQPIMYTGAKGKITWGGKRLTKPTKVTTGREMGTGANNVVDQQPSDEGRGETPENTSTSRPSQVSTFNGMLRISTVTSRSASRLNPSWLLSKGKAK